MHRLPLLTCLFGAGCGRIGFGETAALGDGAQPDGMPDGEVPPLQQSCTVTHPGALLCEGFEPTDVAWDYTVIDEGTALRSTTRSAQGAASLEVTTTDVDNFKAARWGQNGVLPGITSGPLFIREMIWLTGATQVTDQLSIMVTGNFADPFPSANLLLRPGQVSVLVEGSDLVVDLEFPRDRWVCVELELLVGVGGNLKLRFDDQIVTSANGIDTQVAGGYTNVDAGVHYATPGQSSSQMFIDEVVVDTSPIGCN